MNIFLNIDDTIPRSLSDDKTESIFTDDSFMVGDNQKVGVYLSYYVTMKPEDHADDVSKSRFEDNEELKFVALSYFQHYEKYPHVNKI